MTYRINPAFDRRPIEAACIGRILSSFGELEIMVCRNAGRALQSSVTVMRTLYRVRVTSTRIDVADGLMRPTFSAYGLAPDYDFAMGMVRHCIKIRNQYAHCNWAGDSLTGLFFADLEDSAKTEKFDYFFKHVDGALLNEQLEYFALTLEWLEFLNQELAVKLEHQSTHVWPRPPAPSPPSLHNPPDEYVPPWLNEGDKALHVARARASLGGPPTPTPGQQALDKARAEKRAQQEEQRRKSREGEQNAKGRSDPSPEE
jgi:hypothetical protein